MATRYKKSIFKTLVVWLALIVIVVVDPLDGFQTLRNYTLDAYQRFHPVALNGLTSEVVFVEIDDASLIEQGQWPWPRNLIADAMIKLYQEGARGIAVDILFSERDRLSPSNLPIVNIPEALRNEHGYLDWDQYLSDLIGQTPTTLAFAASKANNSEIVASTIQWQMVENAKKTMPRFSSGTFPVTTLLNNTHHLGHIAISTDSDGFIRRVPLLVNVNGESFLNLGLESLRGDLGVHQVTVTSDTFGIKAIELGDYTIATNRYGYFNLVFNVLEQIPRVSFNEVLQGNASIVRGKLVVIGPSATGLNDFHNTPFRMSVPGPLVHAAVIQQVVSDIQLTESYWSDVAIFCAFTLGTLLILLAAYLGKVALSIGITIAIATLFISGSWVAYIYHGLLVDYSLVTVTAVIAAIYGGVRHVLDQKRFIHNAFNSYLPKEVVSEIVKRSKGLKLEGDLKEITVMFVDMKGFTTISEDFREYPTHLASKLSDVLSSIAKTVMSHQGTIDKYLGDAALAFWNAPLSVDSHEYKAIKCALAIKKNVSQISFKHPLTHTSYSVDIVVGINTGPAMVGNIGSDERFNYTCIGDTVNTASRVEGLCRYYHVDLIVTDESLVNLPPQHALNIIPLDRVRLKGKSNPVNLSWIQSEHPSEVEALMASLQTDLLAHYYAQRWEEAECILAQLIALDVYPVALSDIYRERIAQYKKESPGQAWDGVFVAKSKRG